MRLGHDFPRISRNKIIELLAEGLNKTFESGPIARGEKADKRWWDSWVKPRYEYIAKLARGEDLTWSEQEHVAMMIRD